METEYFGKLTAMIRLDEHVENSMQSLIESVRQTDIYQNYISQRTKVEQQPELKQKIDEYRHRNLEIQQNYQGEELLRKMDEFELQYESLCANPLVDRYLSAELAMVRMYQTMEWHLHEGLSLR